MLPASVMCINIQTFLCCKQIHHLLFGLVLIPSFSIHLRRLLSFYLNKSYGKTINCECLSSLYQKQRIKKIETKILNEIDKYIEF